MMLRRILFSLSVTAGAAIAATIGHGQVNFPVGVDFQPVMAGTTCGVPTDCDVDTTGTSSMTVRHERPTLTGGLVQISNTESWTVTAAWKTADDDPYCSCEGNGASATFDVTWNSGTGAWDLSNCAGCTTQPFRGVNICTLQTCNTGFPAVFRAHAYKIIVDLDLTMQQNCPPGGNRNLFLDRVTYETANPSNGNLLNMGDCSLGQAVTPVYGTYRNSDGGAFECAFSCGAAFGPELYISYQ